MNNLLITPEISKFAILLVDTSGSTGEIFDKSANTKYTVYDKMIDIVKTLPESQFRILFWNSEHNIYPYITTKEKIDQTMKIVGKIGGLTYPEVAFNNIPADWYDTNNKTVIYYITDGDIGSIERLVSKSIEQLLKNNSICLNILTVERKNTNLDNIEEVNKAAGSDIYRLLIENKLTTFVSKFISYTLKYPDGYIHLNKNTAPNGFIAYESLHFSELRIGEFIVYIDNLIKSSKSEDQLLKIIQNLTTTLCCLVNDKPLEVRTDIIKNFSNLFYETSIDPMLVNYMLIDSVEKEITGQASVFASYRTQLKDLFRQANLLLYKNTKQAIGMNQRFVSFPVENKIITGNKFLIDASITNGEIKYPYSSVLVNNITLPCFPTNDRYDSPITNQCTRQWIRTVYSKYYNLDVQSDTVIYFVLGSMLQVVLSNVDKEIKDSYKSLATIILQKKRLNSIQTELERLEDGYLPIPNSGKIEHFYDYMQKVNDCLGLTLRPFTLWYAICCALGSSKLIQAQSNHCEKDVSVDFPTIELSHLLDQLKPQIKQIVCFNIPDETALDYNCIITLEPIQEIGGYKISEHKTLQSSICSPMYVISERGYNGMFGVNEYTTCPICYTKLDQTNFKQVGPKPKVNMEVFENNVHDKFKAVSTTRDKYTIQSQTNHYNSESISQNTSGKKFVIVMKGTVGSGKSTYGTEIKKYIESIGGYCTVQGTDQYCKDGASFTTAVSNIRDAFNKAKTNTSEIRVVVVDTCGERSNGTSFFDIDFKGWTKIDLYPNLDRKQINKYYAWTLRNVLRRGKPTMKDNWYLNSSAGVKTCIDVHKKKAISLYGKKDINNFNFSNYDISVVINAINDDANKYQDYLDSLGKIDSLVKDVFNGKL